jgi:hypothetical protein
MTQRILLGIKLDPVMPYNNLLSDLISSPSEHCATETLLGGPKIAAEDEETH